MNQHRQTTSNGYAELLSKDPLLQFQRHRIDWIKTYFTDRPPLRCEYQQLVKNVIIRATRMHRMDAVCRYNPGVFSSNNRNSGPAIGMHSGDDKALYSCSYSFLQNVR